MTTETKPTNNATDNKAIFGPLGKYAVIAVIMVSIIVTTAIMLDKQLNSAEEQIAAIESEVSEMAHAISSDTDTVAIAETAETDSTVDTVEVTAQTDVTTEAKATTASTVAPAIEVTAQTKLEATPAITVESTVTAETATTETIAAEVQIEEAPFAMVDQGQQRQARIDTFKAEQKQRMADMFARIKALEAQQLDQYKVSQEKQLARLHNQVSRQEKMIEALVLRNKDLYELRAANVQRIQTNREEVLNRI